MTLEGEEVALWLLASLFIVPKEKWYKGNNKITEL
jgi:hypothetical protein